MKLNHLCVLGIEVLLATLGVAFALSLAAGDAAPDRIPRVGFLTSMPPWSAEGIADRICYFN